MLEVMFWVIIAVIVLGCAGLLWSTTSDADERIEVYRGEDMHLRVTTHKNLDVPLPESQDVPELEGDRDVAMFWGSHPSVRRSR